MAYEIYAVDQSNFSVSSNGRTFIVQLDQDAAGKFIVFQTTNRQERWSLGSIEEVRDFLQSECKKPVHGIALVKKVN